MTPKDVLKNIGKIALKIGEAELDSIPGTDIIIRGVSKLFDKDKENNFQAVLDIEDGFITAMESIKGNEVADQILLAQGIKDLKVAFLEIKQAIKK